MTWLLQRVLDLIELIVNWFYTRKYGAMARRFGRGTAEDDGRRGLIILQIDGLSHATLAAGDWAGGHATSQTDAGPGGLFTPAVVVRTA